MDEQTGTIQDAYCNFFNEENKFPIASPVCRGFDEFFSPPLYDKYEDDYLEDGGPMWDASSFSSSIEYLYQEELSSLGFIEDISY